MKIFDLLNEYTSDAGSWSIEYNDHKLTYSEPDEHYTSHDEDDSDELDGINTKQDIYRLYWFNNTPVGHYCILANSIEELEEKIIDIIKNDNLTKYKTKGIQQSEGGRTIGKIKDLIVSGYNKLNLYNYLIGFYMNQGNPYSQAKKPALQSYLELLGVKHKKM